MALVNKIDFWISEAQYLNEDVVTLKCIRDEVKEALESLKAGVLDKVESEGGDLSYYEWLFETRIGDFTER